jgi:hypothetical protein
MSDSQTICNLAWADSSLYVYIVAIKNMGTPPLNNNFFCMILNNLLDGKWSIATHNAGMPKKITLDFKSGKFATQVMFFNKFIVQYFKNLHVTINMEK